MGLSNWRWKLSKRALDSKERKGICNYWKRQQ